MTSPLRLRYLHSSVLAAFLNEESLPTADGTPRVEVARRILERAGGGTDRLVTSVLSIAEVRLFPGAAVGSPPSDGVGVFGLPNVHTVNLDIEIATMARRIGVEYSLKPPDAVHLATAVRYDCAELLVWDDAFVRRVSRRPIPGLWVGEPY